MILIDIFIVVFALACVFIGGPLLVHKFLLTDPKRKQIEAASVIDEEGEVNTVKFNLDQLRKCTVCQQMTDPKKDLKVTASWIHPHCYLAKELANINKSDNKA